MGIRCAQKEDIPQILEIYGPYVTGTTATFEYWVPTEAEFIRRFESITAQFPFLVWEEEGSILGYAYASAPFERAAYAWCAEPSVYLLPQAQGRGIGRQLYAALEKILKYQGYQVLYALITQENEGSLWFHQRMGYQFSVLFPNCGFKFGRWLGLIWMEKRLKSVEIPSYSPTPWESIRQNQQKIFDILDTFSLS